MFVKPVVKFSHIERRSGGVIMLVKKKKKQMTVVKNIKVDFDILLVQKCFQCGQRCVSYVSYLLLCILPPTFIILQRQRLQAQFTVGGEMYHVCK